MARLPLTLGRAGMQAKGRSLANSIVPLVGMGLVLTLATLLVKILLTSPSTHNHLLR